MTSILDTVAPKSDQLNADDLIGGQTKTIKITGVTVGTGEQPVSVHYEGENGKPYKAGKSMRRVMIMAWGADTSKYVGRSMTLYCDPTVKFGGKEVGGIRISHMSDIKSSITMALTATRAQRKPFTVKVLTQNMETPASYNLAIEILQEQAARAATGGINALKIWFASLPTTEKGLIKPQMDKFKEIAMGVDSHDE